MKIHQLIHAERNTVFENATLKEVNEAFSKTKADFVAVITQISELVGVIYKTDLNKLEDGDTPTSIAVDNHLYDYYHILETVRAFLKTEKDQLPVVDEEGIYIGVCNFNDIQYHFNRTIGIIEGGSLLVIETKLQNYSLVDVAKIVESNQAKVLLQYVSTHPDSENIEVTLVLNVSDISDIITTFERFSYQVKYSSTASERDDFLKERYDSLMHFLDI